MNFELKVWLSITRKFPKIMGAAYTANLLRLFYLRKKREFVEVDVLSLKMKLDPSECVDGALLFYPHLYERHEIAFLKQVLKPGDTFLDVGANVGFYSLIASQIVGEEGSVLAIEADPYNYEKLLVNLRLNGTQNVLALNIGVSDEEHILRLGLNVTGNRGGNSFLSTSEHGVNVHCYPLSLLLKNNKINKVRAAKFDIEGFEFRVLKRFFNDVDGALYPDLIITEQNQELIEKGEGDVIRFLKEEGYKVVWSLKSNYIMTLSQRPCGISHRIHSE